MSDFRGKVFRKVIAPGSKSEREAVVLETGDQTLVLRRTGGNPFDDRSLESLVGKTISAEGNVLGGYTLLMSKWTEI
jgi:hypothetical protein